MNLSKLHVPLIVYRPSSSSPDPTLSLSLSLHNSKALKHGHCRIRTSSVVDVLLLLGGKQHSYARGHMLCLHYTLCLMQLSVVRNLILMEFSD
jgi:hypothetical protein